MLLGEVFVTFFKFVTRSIKRASKQGGGGGRVRSSALHSVWSEIDVPKKLVSTLLLGSLWYTSQEQGCGNWFHTKSNLGASVVFLFFTVKFCYNQQCFFNVCFKKIHAHCTLQGNASNLLYSKQNLLILA